MDGYVFVKSSNRSPKSTICELDLSVGGKIN